MTWFLAYTSRRFGTLSNTHPRFLKIWGLFIEYTKKEICSVDLSERSQQSISLLRFLIGSPASVVLPSTSIIRKQSHLHTIQPYRTEPLPPAALPSGFSFLRCCINRQILSPVFSRFFSFITPSTSFSSSSQSMAGEERKKRIFPIPYGHPLSAFNSPSLCASVFVCMSVFLCIVCVVNV